MRLIICMTAALAICAIPTQSTAKGPAFQLNETTWTFVDNGTKVRESIDAKGNYIENAISGKHIDHGTAVMKEGKACFTSAMTKDGELCWTTTPVKVGRSFTSTSDKGRKLKVTRVKYTPMKMPK